MITPIKKTAQRDMLDWEKKFNQGINSVRVVIELTIAHLKNWEIMHRDYRRPLDTFTSSYSAGVERPIVARLRW